MKKKMFQHAMERFSPEQRDCYSEDEISLKYLPKSHGYRSVWKEKKNLKS